jgi:hypothetical protein
LFVDFERRELLGGTKHWIVRASMKR